MFNVLCKKLLNELNEVFAVTSLPNDSWKLFNEICGKCEKGILKNQYTLSTDLKGKSTFRFLLII